MRNRQAEYPPALPAEACSYPYTIPAIISTIKELNLEPDSKILEAGCGRGNLVNALYNLGFMNVWGFDVSESCISLSRERFPHITDRFFRHDVFEARLPDSVPQEYDLIISMEVIEHLYDPQGCLKNQNIWLSKHKYLIITTPYHGYLKNVIISLTNKFDRHFYPLYEGKHIRFFSRKTLSSILTAAGFEILRFKGLGRAPYIWKTMMLLARKI